MDFSLTEEQQMVRQAARDFAQTELLPGVIERDEKQEFPTRQVQACLLYTSPSPRDQRGSRMPSSA